MDRRKRSRARRVLVAGALALAVAAGMGPGVREVEGQTRKTIAMREKVYEKLSRAQEAMEAEDWVKAAKALEDVAGMRDLDGNEKAQLYTAYGYFHFAQERYRESIEAYERVLEQEELPEALRTTTLYTLAQLRFHTDDYAKAADHLERWMESATNPGPEPLVLLGQAYYQMERYREATDAVERAVALAEERGQDPRQEWYGILRALYHELEDHPRLLEVLEILITNSPKKEYWLHLAATYGEMGDDDRRLAAYEIAHAEGFLDSGPERIVLAQLRLQAGMPYEAGSVLESGIRTGLVEATAGNWRLLAQAWSLAHEDARAIEALTAAAALSDDGEMDARLAQSYANLDDWENAVRAAETALTKGVGRAHEVHLLLGTALFELGRHEEARTAFRAAQKFEESRRTASQWIAYIEREEERLRELRLP